MSRSEWIAMALALAGCNAVFGITPTVLIDAASPDSVLPDLDRDGIVDSASRKQE